MPNPDRQFENAKTGGKVTNAVYAIMLFVVFGIPLILLLSYLIFPNQTKGFLRSFNSNQPNCQYYGDSYECE